MMKDDEKNDSDGVESGALAASAAPGVRLLLETRRVLHRKMVNFWGEKYFWPKSSHFGRTIIALGWHLFTISNPPEKSWHVSTPTPLFGNSKIYEVPVLQAACVAFHFHQLSLLERNPPQISVPTNIRTHQPMSLFIIDLVLRAPRLLIPVLVKVVPVIWFNCELVVRSPLP